MSKISGKETKPEVLVRKYLFAEGFRFRKNVKTLPGKPDIVLARYRSVIFVHGCFWHCHAGCKKATIPKTNTAFWEGKISSNVTRDSKAVCELQQAGWHVIIIWQCELGNVQMRNKTFSKLVKDIKNQNLRND